MQSQLALNVATASLSSPALISSLCCNGPHNCCAYEAYLGTACTQVTLVLRESAGWRDDDFIVVDVLGNPMFKLCASHYRIDQKRSLVDLRTGQVGREGEWKDGE